MDVRVAALKAFDRAPGSPVLPGEVISVPDRVASRWIDEKKVVYYADFSNSLIEKTPCDEVKTATVKVQRSKTWERKK
jgi:hypothetical protein